MSFHFAASHLDKAVGHSASSRYVPNNYPRNHYPHVVGGAIELTVTAQKDAPSDNHTSLSNSTDSVINFSVMGYAALFGNTFCMVRYFIVLQ